jgi:hypothetical protein
MTKSQIFKKAHEIAKTLEGNYCARLSYSLKLVYSNIKKGAVKMIELVGSEKQVAWATEIRNNNIKTLIQEVEEFKGRETREDCSYSVIIGKIEKAIEDIKNGKPEAKWWIENKGIANWFLQKIKRSA